MYERRGHHILHNRQEWTLRDDAKNLRERRTLIVPMERDLHNDIHSTCPAIPLLGYHALARTRAAFEEGRTPLQSLDNLMVAIEQSAQHPKAHALEKSLAELAVMAIDLQRPFIKEATHDRFIAA